METEHNLRDALAATGLSEEKQNQFQTLLRTGNVPGQKRFLTRCYCAQKELQQTKRRQLACLDYLIAKMEMDHEE